jgi:hypothetical protein
MGPCRAGRSGPDNASGHLRPGQLGLEHGSTDLSSISPFRLAISSLICTELVSGAHVEGAGYARQPVDGDCGSES